MNDSKLLHFLKNFPAWIVLSTLFLVVLWLYVQTDNQFFQRVIDTVLGALLGILTGRATQSANTNSGDVNITPNLDLTQPEVLDAVENIKEEK